MVVGLFSGGTSLNSGADPLNFRLLAAPDRRKLSSSPSNFPNRKTSPLSSHHSGFSGTRKAIKMISDFRWLLGACLCLERDRDCKQGGGWASR